MILKEKRFGLIVGCIVLALWMSYFTVQSGTRKLVFTAGKLTSVADEGLHFKIPLYQRTKTVDVTTLKTAEEAKAASKDLQEVQAAISVNYHFDIGELIDIYNQTSL